MKKGSNIGYIIFVVMIGLLVLYALRQRQNPDRNLTYTVVDEVLSDNPGRTLIKKYIVVSGIPTEAELEFKLNNVYQAILADAKDGRYYRRPEVFIGIYGTKDAAQAGNLWIGVLDTSPFDYTPVVSISESRLAALSQAPEERFGFSEQRRKELFHALTSAEDRADCVSFEQIPDWHSQRRINLENKLEQQYLAEVAQLYDLTLEDLVEPPEELFLKLTVEASDKGWPPPPYPCE